MNIQEIYDAYSIPPSLQEHMLRVAAIAKYICNHTSQNININDIISSCLLHDMGNIIKFTFDTPIAGISVYEDIEYREKVQKKFIDKYTNDEHLATIMISKEVTNNKNILTLVESTGFSKIAGHLSSENLSAKICCYADMRVMPYGVVSITERMKEAYQRNAGKKDRVTTERIETSLAIVLQLEQEVMEHCTITPEAITHEIIEPTTALLRDFRIESFSS